MRRQLPLHCAAQGSSPDVLKLFLGLDPSKINAQNKKGVAWPARSLCSMLFLVLCDARC